MYLRHTTLRKDGKVHRYWRLVRSVRVGRKIIQQTVAHLGELDAEGRAQVRALARAITGEPEQDALRAGAAHRGRRPSGRDAERAPVLSDAPPRPPGRIPRAEIVTKV